MGRKVDANNRASRKEARGNSSGTVRDPVDVAADALARYFSINKELVKKILLRDRSGIISIEGDTVRITTALRDQLKALSNSMRQPGPASSPKLIKELEELRGKHTAALEEQEQDKSRIATLEAQINQKE